MLHYMESETSSELVVKKKLKKNTEQLTVKWQPIMPQLLLGKGEELKWPGVALVFKPTSHPEKWPYMLDVKRCDKFGKGEDKLGKLNISNCL